MQNYLETLQALTTDKVINIRDYYCVTLQTGVQLQGVYSSELLKTFKNRRDLDPALKICVGDNGFIAISFKYNEYSVEITLT